MDVDEKRSRLNLHRSRFKGNYSNITCSDPTFSLKPPHTAPPVLPFHSPMFTRHSLIKLMKRENPLMSKDGVPRLSPPVTSAAAPEQLTFMSYMRN